MNGKVKLTKEESIYKMYMDSVNAGYSKGAALLKAMLIDVKLSRKKVKHIISIEALKTVMVNTLKGKESLHHLCLEIGIKERKVYWCMKEPIKTGTHVGLALPPPVKYVHDYEFVFKDGFEILGVDKSVFMLFPGVEITEVKKRHDCRL